VQRDVELGDDVGGVPGGIEARLDLAAVDRVDGGIQARDHLVVEEDDELTRVGLADLFDLVDGHIHKHDCRSLCCDVRLPDGGITAAASAAPAAAGWPVPAWPRRPAPGSACS